MQAADVVDFWIQAGSKAWFAKSDAFDQAIRARFEALHHSAARGELIDWNATATGALALLLLLDQFPRNLFRGSAHAFATDPLARLYAGQAIDRGHDLAVAANLRPFFYLPFEHSEHAADQARALNLCGTYSQATGDQEILRYARLHADIISRFGRFPHRNATLGRQDTDEESEFLKNGGFAG